MLSHGSLSRGLFKELYCSKSLERKLYLGKQRKTSSDLENLDYLIQDDMHEGLGEDAAAADAEGLP